MANEETGFGTRGNRVRYKYRSRSLPVSLTRLIEHEGFALSGRRDERGVSLPQPSRHLARMRRRLGASNRSNRFARVIY